MDRRSRDAAFTFSHGAWSSLRPEVIVEGGTVRRLSGGTSEAWLLELPVGAAVASGGVGCESMLSVADGKIECRVFGNQVELPRGNFALIPPNVPFQLRVSGRAPAVVVLYAASRIPENTLEPA